MAAHPATPESLAWHPTAHPHTLGASCQGQGTHGQGWQPPQNMGQSGNSRILPALAMPQRPSAPLYGRGRRVDRLASRCPRRLQSRESSCGLGIPDMPQVLYDKNTPAPDGKRWEPSNIPPRRMWSPYILTEQPMGWGHGRLEELPRLLRDVEGGFPHDKGAIIQDKPLCASHGIIPVRLMDVPDDIMMASGSGERDNLSAIVPIDSRRDYAHGITAPCTGE